MQAVAAAVVETAQTWEQAGIAPGAVREGIGGVAEPFLQRLMLVWQDVATGDLRCEDVADDRPLAPWDAVVAARLTALGPAVFAVVSARANALSQLAEQGLEGLSMPDFFHGVQEIVQRYSRAMGQRWRHAQQELMKAQAALVRRQGLPQAEPATRAAQAWGEARQAEVTRGQEVPHPYRSHLETRSLTLHPFRIAASRPQTSAQVDRQRTVAVEAIGTLAQWAQVPARREAITQGRKQFPALAALVDFWWQGVPQD